MLCWAFKANFTKSSRRTTQAISFHDMAAERPRSEMKSVTHVYAQSVTNVSAPCREEVRSLADGTRGGVESAALPRRLRLPRQRGALQGGEFAKTSQGRTFIEREEKLPGGKDPPGEKRSLGCNFFADNGLGASFCIRG